MCVCVNVCVCVCVTVCVCVNNSYYTIIFTGSNWCSCSHCSATLRCHGDPGRTGGTDTAMAQERRGEKKASRYVHVHAYM